MQVGFRCNMWLFTAYSPDIGITLATEAYREKSNEIMAVLAYGRIETRTYHAYEGLKLIADKEKWGGN